MKHGYIETRCLIPGHHGEPDIWGHVHPTHRLRRTWQLLRAGKKIAEGHAFTRDGAWTKAVLAAGRTTTGGAS